MCRLRLRKTNQDLLVLSSHLARLRWVSRTDSQGRLKACSACRCRQRSQRAMSEMQLQLYQNYNKILITPANKFNKVNTQWKPKGERRQIVRKPRPPSKSQPPGLCPFYQLPSPSPSLTWKAKHWNRSSKTSWTTRQPSRELLSTTRNSWKISRSLRRQKKSSWSQFKTWSLTPHQGCTKPSSKTRSSINSLSSKRLKEIRPRCQISKIFREAK
jgi:hypothetical protein